MPARVPGMFEAHSFAVAKRGNHIAWSRVEEHESIYRIELASGAVSRFAPSTRSDSQPQFSPDGQRVVFVSDRSGTEAIWVCTSQGSGCYAVNAMDAPNPGSPSWSRAGKQIAFDSVENARSDIDIVSAEGGVPRILTHGPNDSVRPSWSADGKWIYFASRRAGIWRMIRMPAEGGPEMQITKNGGFGTAVESAKNDFLYYSKGGLPGIWKVPVSGGTEERASTLGDEGAWAFVGGGLYLFTARPDSREINFFDFTTRKLHRITELPIGSRSTMRNNIFALSPDHRIALYTQVDGTGEDIMLTDGFR